MDRRNISILIAILLLTGLMIWINTSTLEYTFTEEPEGVAATQEAVPWWAALMFWQGDQQRSVKIHQGLDLQGGTQVVLESDLPEQQELAPDALEAARIVVDNRVNGLGVTEPLVQLEGSNRMIVELPGIDDPELAISTIRETGLLEFVDAGRTPIPDGALIQTSLGGPQLPAGGETSGEAAGGVEVFQPDTVYETVITGSDLDQVSNAGLNPERRVVEINFSLKSEGGQKFGDYTGDNIGNYLCIILDKQVLSLSLIHI